jgi:flagellar basal-body rod protein FlgB
MFASTPIPLLEQWLSFSQARHSVLAGNIANVDTPGYQARDLSVERFQELLRDAWRAPVWTNSTSLYSDQLSPGQTARPATRDERLQQVRQRYPSLLRHDGGDVNLEEQISELTKNQMMHSLVVSILNSQFRLLQAAVSERV